MVSRKDYLRMHNEAGFSEGDYVMVVRKCSSYYMGWGAMWHDEMDKSIGTIQQIVCDRKETGFALEDGYLYPWFCLSLEKRRSKLNFSLRGYDLGCTRPEIIEEALEDLLSGEYASAASAKDEEIGEFLDDAFDFCVHIRDDHDLLKRRKDILQIIDNVLDQIDGM